MRKISINLHALNSLQIQNKSIVSMEGQFSLDGSLAQDATIGALQSRWKLWVEVPDQDLTRKISVKLQNACKWVYFKNWKPCVRGQTLFTRHRPHTSYWLSTLTRHLCSALVGCWANWKVNYLWMNVWHTMLPKIDEQLLVNQKQMMQVHSHTCEIWTAGLALDWRSWRRSGWRLCYPNWWWSSLTSHLLWDGWQKVWQEACLRLVWQNFWQLNQVVN